MTKMFMELQTPSGKPFRCKAVEGGEIIVYHSDERGIPQEKEAYVITPFILDLVKGSIKARKEVVIGASRDNPKLGSLGDILKKEGLSPQYLSYVVGLLIHQKYCTLSGTRPARVARA